MDKNFLNSQCNTSQLVTDFCFMGTFNLICSCGYKEKLVYKDRDYCPECGNKTIDIETHMIAGELNKENSTFFQQSFYQLSIGFDYELNDYGVIIESEYKLSFDFSAYILKMEKFANNQLILTKETQLLDRQANFYLDIIKTFNSNIIYFDDQNTQKNEFQDNHFIMQLDNNFPSFVSNWLYYIFNYRDDK